MRRFADLFIAICIPIVAMSAGAVAHWQFAQGAGATAAAIAGVLAASFALQWTANRRRQGQAGDERIQFLSRRLGELAADNDALERRLKLLEDGAGRGRRDEIEQMVAEIEVIGTLTRQVIETVADLEGQVGELRGATARAPVAEAAAAPAAPAAPRPAARNRARSALVPESFAHLDEDGFLAVVRGAIDADRIDLHLQPIVGLPQRKVRFYEALIRLRGEDGTTIHPSDFIPIAESRGYMAAIDEQILLKAVAILRRLSERSREVGVFLNLSAASLGHPGFFRDFHAYLEKNRDLADMLVLEFPQASIRAMGPLEQEGLAALKSLGFRFSVDQVTDLKISFQNLADRGVRWTKISADRLLNRIDEMGTDIHPVDLTDYFRRFGMELIADHIEREAEVLDVLDYGVRLGQGNLFAPPRAVKVDTSALERPAGALARAAAAMPAAPVPASSDVTPTMVRVRESRPADGRAGEPRLPEVRAAEGSAAEGRARAEPPTLPAVAPRPVSGRTEALPARAAPPRPEATAVRAPAAAERIKRAPDRPQPAKPAPREGEARPAGIRIIPPSATQRS
jgi:cyclic-di-GMP phosphodiesterase TipF (flagellum assembly factor)